VRRAAVTASRSVAVLLVVFGLFSGCAHTGSTDLLPASSAAPWIPPPEVTKEEPAPAPRVAAVQVPPELQRQGATVDLATVVQVALANNPATRETWLGAQAAAAEMESRKGAYYPRLDFSVSGQRTRQSAVGGQFVFQQTNYGPALDLTWLLFDSGGRKADVEQARQQLIAADWSHNDAVQQVVFAVEQAYYDYQTAKAARDAARSDLDAAQRNLEAAKTRHDAGLATIADVLQAKTAASQARLQLQSIEGQIQATRGALATAMGVPVTLPIDTAPLPQDLPKQSGVKKVEAWMEQALADRPDLLALRAEAKAARANVDKSGAKRLPSVSLRGNSNRVFYGSGGAATNYSLGLSIGLPVFTGFELESDVRKAKAEAGQAEARVATLEDQIALDVWTAYYDFQTASQQLDTSQDLLRSAEQSADVTAGRYKAGVGSILDLLSSQAALASARAQDVLARAGYLLSIARLSRAAGRLHIPAGTPAPATTPEDEP
jgi:outer membrane protein